MEMVRLLRRSNWFGVILALALLYAARTTEAVSESIIGKFFFLEHINKVYQDDNET